MTEKCRRCGYEMETQFVCENCGNRVSNTRVEKMTIEIIQGYKYTPEGMKPTSENPQWYRKEDIEELINNQCRCDEESC